MKLFFAPDQLRHRPQQYFRFGKIGAPVENPERMETLAQALAALGLDRREPADAGLEPILAVHDPAYVDFLQRIWGLWRAMPEAGPEVLPNVHPYRSADASFARVDRPRNTGPIGLAGYHIGDMSCAMGEGTWAAAHASAQTAIAGADALLAGEAHAFSLCRPPGHHCYRDRANGFCFLNNAAIAAERLRSRFARVAILDFDTHHGDGTQAIFYRRGDILVASSHTDPTDYYPSSPATPTSAAMARARARTSTSCWSRARMTRRSWRRCRGWPTRSGPSARMRSSSPPAGTRTATIRSRSSPSPARRSRASARSSRALACRR